MVQVSTGANTIVTMDQALSGAITDDRGKPVKFKQVEKSDPPRFEGNGSDGRVYGFQAGDALVSVTASSKADLKDLRRRSKGFPVNKDEAKKIDDEIAKEEGEEEKEGEEKTEEEKLQEEQRQAAQRATAARETAATNTAATKRTR
ncbi:MAG TPA: hypothetical protein VHJ59_03300 [Nitrososphaera sp.]|jgi:hypothetical protein|nr:hypothetical protein [Nitrososphaera sp.]